MASIVRVPALGAAIANVIVVRWAVDEGAAVKQGATLLEVETDKMNMDIPADRSGVLHRILVSPGTETQEGRPLAVIGDASEQVGDLVAQALTELGAPVGSDAPAEAEPATAPEAEATAVEGAKKVRASPVARRVARELGIDLAQIKPSGKGREMITEGDVRRHNVETRAAAAAAAVASPSSTRPAPVSGGDDLELIPLVGARRVLADRVAESARIAPHFTMTLEIDCMQLVAARDALQSEFERETGARLTYTPFLVKAIARAVQDVPIVNSSLVGDEIHVRKTANVGVAVAVDDVIFVPVIREPIAKSIIEIGGELNRLTQLARARKLGPEDSLEGTITLSNVGGTEIVNATAIINQPQVAMIATTRIVDRVVPINGAITVRPQMNALFTYDHRVVQGIPGARFAERMKAYLEHPLDS